MVPALEGEKEHENQDLKTQFYFSKRRSATKRIPQCSQSNVSGERDTSYTMSCLTQERLKAPGTADYLVWTSEIDDNGMHEIWPTYILNGKFNLLPEWLICEKTPV